ncbi:MAG: hypothetical protein J7L76_01665 [Spirochaetaceae bacterium]|nr:hypothetical protein [Spirochaetaceae bacterium]
MKWESLLELIGDEPIFSSKLLMAGQKSSTDIQLQLSRWLKSGRLFQLRRGWYALAPPYRKVEPHPFFIANQLKKASYISLQSALSFYGMIPEYVPVITSVTTGRPEVLNTPEGTFQYKHVKNAFFSGYHGIQITGDKTVFIATPEKCLLDLIYLTPGSHSFEYLRELRLQNDDVLDMDKMMEMADDFGGTKLVSAVKLLRRIFSVEEYRDL